MIFRETVDLENFIRQGIVSGDLDYVAWAGSPWTALGVDVAIKDLEVSGGKLKGLICIYPTKSGAYIVAPEDFPYAGAEGVEFCRVAAPPSLGGGAHLLKVIFWLLMGSGSKSSDRRSFYLMVRGTLPLFAIRLLTSVPSSVRRGFGVFRIDEGFLCNGSFYLRFLTGLYSTKEPRGMCGGALLSLRLLFLLTFDKVLALLARGRLEVCNRYLVVEKGGRLVSDESLLRSYKELLIRSNVRANSSASREVLVLTQPFLDYLDQEKVCRLLREICRNLESLGYRALIKVHPREISTPIPSRFFGLEEYFFPEPRSVEALLAVKSYAFVVGFTSTSLVSAPLLFETPSISLGECLLTCGHHTFVEVNVREFSRKSANIVRFADSMEEFSRLVSASDATPT